MLPHDSPPYATIYFYFYFYFFDGGKKVKGRKRHLVVDAKGF